MKNRDDDKIEMPTNRRCKRCGKLMKKWTHSPNWTPLFDKGYHPYWHQCTNKKCKTDRVMDWDKFVPSEKERLAELQELEVDTHEGHCKLLDRQFIEILGRDE